MGWTWASWFIQRLHTYVITQCGIPPRSIVTGDWPPLPVAAEAITLPYCDTVTVLSTDRDVAIATRD
eukprot:11538057-Heterocapsa_arctica.AAC.1